MSRNLCRVDCRECPGGHEHIVIEGPIREVTAKEDPAYINDHRGLLIAEARCVLCHALYVAWIDWSNQPHSHWHLKAHAGQRFCDLSYRHAFNDEPCVLDLPVYEVEQVIHYRRRPKATHPYFNDRDKDASEAFKTRWNSTVNSGMTIADEMAALPEGVAK